MKNYLHLHHYLNEYPSHAYYGEPGFSLWHIIGIVIGIILLCALIGIIVNCLRSGTVYTGAPGTVVY